MEAVGCTMAGGQEAKKETLAQMYVKSGGTRDGVLLWQGAFEEGDVPLKRGRMGTARSGIRMLVKRLVVLAAVIIILPAFVQSARKFINCHFDHSKLIGPFGHVDFSGSDFKYCNLRGADLNHANFSRVVVSHSDLTHTDLSGADLSGAEMSHSNLKDANLSDADLSGADFRTVENLAAKAVKAAKHWDLAFYDDKMLKALGLPPDNNAKLQLLKSAGALGAVPDAAGAARKDFAENSRKSATVRIGGNAAAKFDITTEGPDATFYVVHIVGVTSSICSDMLTHPEFVSKLRGLGFTKLVCTDDGKATFTFDLPK
ncbi:MAG: pentapeptide repeat-containing protein [Bryobacteraceae bacterium]